MTKEKQRIAIAEFCGWANVHMHTVEDEVASLTQPIGTIPNGVLHNILVPNYPEDLNAMHEAEKQLRRAPLTYQPGGIGHYTKLLEDICGTEGKCLATASQRAEALLRTIGKWVESHETGTK